MNEGVGSILVGADFTEGLVSLTLKGDLGVSTIVAIKPSVAEVLAQQLLKAVNALKVPA